MSSIVLSSWQVAVAKISIQLLHYAHELESQLLPHNCTHVTGQRLSSQLHVSAFSYSCRDIVKPLLQYSVQESQNVDMITLNKNNTYC